MRRRRLALAATAVALVVSGLAAGGALRGDRFRAIARIRQIGGTRIRPNRTIARKRSATPTPPQGPLAGRPQRAGGDPARPQPGVEARPVRAAGHRGRVHRPRRELARAARLQHGPHRHALGRHHAGRARAGRPDVPAEVAAGDGPAVRARHLDAARRAPGPVPRDLRRRGRAGLGAHPAAAVRRRPAAVAAVPDQLLDARGLDRLRRLLGEPGRRPRRLGEVVGDRGPLVAPAAAPHGLRPDQRAMGGPGVADLPRPDRLPRVLRGRAAARAGQGDPRHPPHRRRQPGLVGAAAVRRRPADRHLLHRPARRAAARVQLAQLLPRGVPRVAGPAGRRRREVPASTAAAATSTPSTRRAG